MILTTTGLIPIVTISGLRGSDNNDFQIVHADTVNLLDFYSIEDIQQVLGSIQTQITLGNITAQTQEGDAVLDVNEVFEDTSQLSADIDQIEEQLGSIPDFVTSAVSDWDLIRSKGVYHGGGGTLNRPPGFNGFERGFVFNYEISSGQPITIQQVFDGATGRVAARRFNNSAGVPWSEWTIYSGEEATQVLLDLKADITDLNAEITNRIAADQAHVDAPNPHPQYLLELPEKVLRFPVPSAANAGSRIVPFVNAAGSDYEFFREFLDYERRDDPLAHQLVSGANGGFFNYLQLDTNIPEAGDYKLILSYQWSMNTAGSNFLAHIRDQNGDFFYPAHLEPADSAGTGQNVPNSQGGTTNTGTDQFDFFHRELPFTFAPGPQSFIFEFRGQFRNAEPTVYNCFLGIERVRRG